MVSTKLIAYSTIIAFNIFVFFVLLYKYSENLLIPFSMMTVWSLTADTMYYVGIVYFEFKYRSDLKALQKNRSYYFLTNILYKYVCIVALSVLLGFWALTLAGDLFMQFPDKPAYIILTVYPHGIVNLAVWFDMFFTPHKFVENLRVDVPLGIAGCLGYGLLILIEERSLGYAVYPFIPRLSALQNILMFCISYLVMFFSYIIYKNALKRYFAKQERPVGELLVDL